MGSLSHLTQLRALKVEVPGTVSGLAGLVNLLQSLTGLFVGGWGQRGVIIVLPKLEITRKAKCLARLKTLHRCSMEVTVGSIANLKGLTSLSFRHCGVGRDLDAVMKLTNLVCLDLTGVTTLTDSALGEWQPWSRFEAWPALCVFKFVGCRVIDNYTVLDIASVQEVHADRLARCWVIPLGTVQQSPCPSKVHLVLWSKYDVIFETLISISNPGWSMHIVHLHVATSERRDGAVYLSDRVKQVLEALLTLESFHFAGGYDESYGQPVHYVAASAYIVLDDGYSGQLKDLKLQDLCYHTLDFGVATCLTSISLRNVDQPSVSCDLILPSSVVRLEVFGKSLTTRHAKCVLEGLPSLTHITLGTKKFDSVNELELSSSACMPTMPGSLRWLSVTTKAVKNLLDSSAQDCLRFCTGLEHLILPLGQCPIGELDAWVKSACYVRISDTDPEEVPWWRDAYYVSHIV